ncbi:MAG: hypothetical protein ACOCRA_01980 [Halobacteria archaeon]
MTKATRKVEEGKLVEVRVKEGNVRVLGDFFMHPEERITGLEKVVAENVDGGVEPTHRAVETFLREENVELLGIDACDVAETAVEAHVKHEEDDEV